MATWEEGTCNEKSGFLFKHECFQLPSGNCQACGKPVCEDHAHELPDGTFCTTCARTHLKSGKAKPTSSSDDTTSSRTYHDHYYYGNDPFLYSSSYYYGYHYGSSSWRSTSHRDSSGTSSDTSENDPRDFTEADGGSFEVEADADLGGDDFENDMSES